MVYDLGGGTFDITIISIKKGEIHVICTGGDNNLGGKDWDDRIVMHLAEVFKVFGDSTRIRIISALMDGEMCVYHLSEKLNMGQSAISHQLRILRSAGLVRPRKDGKESYYSLDDEHVEEIFGAGLAHVLHKGGMLNV